MRRVRLDSGWSPPLRSSSSPSRMSAGATLHESRAEADGACLACIFALSTVGVHVAVFTWSARPILVGIVAAPEAWRRRARVDRLSSESRGPPLA